jgi:LuxR family maltose regulon positive regulatory protein
MATVGETVRPRIRPRRIIERPRLIRLLDDSSARIRLLIGAAGYGKTTLAEQWAARPGRRVGWVRCRRSSSDIAVVSRLIAAAGATVIPGCERRFEQRLSVTPDPSQEVDVLAEILAEDLAPWPRDAWIVIDDYHFVMEAAAAERFVEVVAGQSPVQLLIASRTRPSWVSSRHRLYEEVLELDQAHLAMVAEETAELLGDLGGRHQALTDLASGWPAIVGLAGQSAAAETSVPILSTAYDFFAEEVYRTLTPEVRSALGVFAALPSLDWELARAVFGPEAARICRDALAVGLLDERDNLLELHPLARSFLDRRRAERGAEELGSILVRCLDVYRRRGDWDAAFDLVERGAVDVDFESLLTSALDALLREARLATIERWLDLASGARLATPAVQLARAELSMRRGHHLRASTLAEHALHLSDDRADVRFRALLVAGQAAHIGTNEHLALEYFKRAESVAPTPDDAREALWGQLMCLSELEADEAADVLEELARSIPRDDARQLVREVGRRLGVEFRRGAFRSIRRAADVLQLLELVDDPVVRASFRSTYSTSLALSARYGAARDVACELLIDAEAHRLDFARPYGLSTLAIALAGLHDYAGAEKAVGEALQLSRDSGNSHAEFNAFAVLLRILLQQGRVDEALLVPDPLGRAPGKGILGEVTATRALVRACAGRLDDATRILAEARGVTTAIEARVLIPCVEAVVSLMGRHPTGAAAAEAALMEAETSGAVDLLVTAYRANAQLCSVLIVSERLRERFGRVLALAGDEALAAAAGHPIPGEGDRASRLSRREREVYDLLCQGLTNRQIAECLVISEQTVKLHVHHVFDKLGVRSRTALIVEAARSQAAPRMDSGDGSTSDAEA